VYYVRDILPFLKLSAHTAEEVLVNLLAVCLGDKPKIVSRAFQLNCNHTYILAVLSSGGE
jgi:hypothetical protein